MSKINAVRLINLNYNNNTIRISDETFQMKGESTLLSLQNGGGKSVLVQMLIAPFVHRRYRDAIDRPFESYFTTGKPSFILVEWALDQGAGYVLTGLMVRRRQEINDETDEELEAVQFICEYKSACPQDIRHLPVVEKKKKEIVLKNFSTCRQLFESYKKDPAVKFFSYDAYNSAQARQYFHKLSEYRIYYKEWETIIKKINLKESGLSELFSDCKDEKGLVEKWLLDAVASKLNKEKDRMKEFQGILEKYVGQYKDNQEKIRQRDIIRQFGEDAAGIMEAAKSCEAVERNLQDQKRRIGAFMWQLEQAKGHCEQALERLAAETARVSEEIDGLRYQQVSRDVYEAMEQERYHRANREMIQLEREAKERDYVQANDQLHLLELARMQLELDEQAGECERYRQQLATINQQEQDFAQERGQLGSTLYWYYEAEKEKNCQEEAEAVKRRQALQERIAQEAAKAQTLRDEVLEDTMRIGAMEAKIQSYDAKEARYNRRYAPGFVRNILGEYEPAALEICQQECEKELDGVRRAYLQLKQETENGKWKQKETARNLEDARQKKMEAQARLNEAQALCDRFEQQLKERRNLMRYFGVDEQMLYDQDGIVAAAEKKLAEIELAKRRIEKEEEQLQKELYRLNQGKVMELPEPFEQMLGDAGISYVYGMEWLRKNSYTEAENKELVRSHPFLPYALLLSQKDLQKLKNQTDLPYTPFPIPLIGRERLEQPADAAENGMVSFSDVSFYLLFNSHLLNEEKRKQLAAGLERQIARKQEQIAQRREEYASYFEKKEQLRGQSVTRERIDQAQKARALADGQLHSQIETIQKIEEEAGRLAAYLADAERRARENARQQADGERRLEDLKELAQAYDAYVQEKGQLQQLQNGLAQAKEKEQLALGMAERLREQAKKLEFELERLRRSAQRLEQKAGCYAPYMENPAKRQDVHSSAKKTHTEKTEDANTGTAKPETSNTSTIEKSKLEEMENRFVAITSKLSLRQQELERLLQSAGERLRRQEREVARRCKKYGLREGDWKSTAYDAQTEEYQEQLVLKKQQQYELKKAQWNEADKRAALASQRLEQQRMALMEKCHRQEPLPQAEIQPVDFEAEMQKREYRLGQLEQARQQQQTHIVWYDENLTALAEYSEYMPADETALWECLQLDMEAIDTNAGEKIQAAMPAQIAAAQSQMEALDGEGLRRKKGMLVRDYHQELTHKQARKDVLTRRLNQMARRELFAGDFYRKPIEAMLTLTDNAGQVIRQLETTLQSYENLMEKIQVDISMIEEEKMRIVDLLGEYVHEVHKNLGRIDQNSTISIRGRSVKMLKILLPDWEEQAQAYQLRIQDFMDETTQKGIALLEQNENAQEYFGVRMTTKNLYDAVVGIAHVQIRLYKIEAQREYPITWSQVAKNSGGEGFLSAFIILTSLLYYMRRDESDLFAESNEGKVLVMDNPFAQTNASHLLKPLMDMAKRTNTQLICLSGLGGESIYSRFDNIYVLNLIAAGLRNGMQYVKAEHMRGEEEETLLISQIEVLEQMERIE